MTVITEKRERGGKFYHNGTSVMVHAGQVDLLQLYQKNEKMFDSSGQQSARVSIKSNKKVGFFGSLKKKIFNTNDKKSVP